MFKETNKPTLLLLLIFSFSFIYRYILMTWAIYPSGADIGLHNSVIHSITLSGNTDFLWNFYQMGGGLSLTFPGYHIFAAYIMFLTGMPDYLVHAIVASLFSSLIVLNAFLITRALWRTSAALIVAFLVAISRFDVEMLLWGGYPNVITLLLIPLVFYLYLQKDRFTLAPFLISASVLSGAIFLTHSLSAGVFIAIVFVTVIIGVIFSKQIDIKKIVPLSYLLPIIGGAILVSPFLINAIPAYLTANSETFTSGATSISQAVLSTRILPFEIILPLFACVFLFFLLSKKYQSKFLTLPTLLLVMWIFIPALLTQGYLIGFYIDYNRFLYFVILPVMILIGLSIDHGSAFFAKIIVTYRALTSQIQQTQKTTHKKLEKLASYLTGKNIYTVFAVGFLLFSFFVIPIFLTPKQGTTVQSFYQVMTKPRYDAMQWAKQNTPADSVFVSDAYYGWWFSGFARRPTLSAVDPQFLTLARELKPAQVAKDLLDTDYMVDNGLIQVREDGGYLARHNPEILVKLNWTYFPYSFFNFNSNQTRIEYEVNGNLQFAYLDKLPVKDMRIENDTEHATIIVTKGNDFFNCTQLTTIYRGLSFVNMTIKLESTAENVSLDWLHITVQSKGKVIQPMRNSTISLIDESVKAFGQLIFKENQPTIDSPSNENSYIIGLQYALEGKSQGEIQISASAYSVTDNLEFYKDSATINSYFNPIITANLNSTQTPTELLIGEVFDYQAAIKSNSISYIVCRDPELKMKFATDPSFNLVFINNEVAIFKVRASINQVRR